MQRRTFVSASTIALLMGALPVATSGLAKGRKSESFADNGFGEGVAVVQHPAGEYRDGKTYVSYQGPLEDPYVAVYDHASDSWDGPYQAGMSLLGKGLEYADKIDSHGKPTLLIDQLGYVHIFYGGHGGAREMRDQNTLGDVHAGANKHAVSKRPFDITEWEDLDNISPFGTYNQALMMANGDVYLFYRHGAHRSNWVYQKSIDNGRTFGEPVSFLAHKRRTDTEATDSWYPWVAHGRGDEIIVSFDYHICRDSWPGRSHQGERHNLYYMTFNTADGTWRNVQGEELPMPLDRETADTKARVFESDEWWTFNQSAALDDRGYPHIGIVMGPDIGVRHGGPKAMRHFRWNGIEWIGGHDSGMPVSRGDIRPQSQEKVSFLLGAQDEEKGTRVGKIAWWNSDDGGRTFRQGKVLLERRGKAFTVSAFIKNAHPDALMIVAESAPRNSQMRPMYLVGRNGPIGRS